MIRFEPDNPLQALTRFFDMAAPDANVYIEIPAPDLRMGAFLLVAVVAALLWRHLRPRHAPSVAMAVLLLVSAAVWLATSGNGRYFLPMLVCVGPVAVGLLCSLPIARRWKAMVAIALAAGQIFVLTQQPPWHAWEWVAWEDASYFGVELGPEQKNALPTTYASVSTISYSLIAPQFPANSRWISLAAGGASARDQLWTDAFLRRSASSGPIRLIAPSLPSVSLATGLPTPAALAALDKLIAHRNLRIHGDCSLIPSVAQARLEGQGNAPRKASSPPVGFWSCPLVLEERASKGALEAGPPAPVQRSFERLADLCPRFFPNHDGEAVRVSDGWERHYGSDTRAYILDSGEIWYKFWRSMNPVFVGTVADLLNGRATVDCSAIRGSDGAWKSGSQ